MIQKLKQLIKMKQILVFSIFVGPAKNSEIKPTVVLIPMKTD
jgi:hypothetical protein